MTAETSERINARAELREMMELVLVQHLSAEDAEEIADSFVNVFENYAQYETQKRIY